LFAAAVAVVWKKIDWLWEEKEYLQMERAATDDDIWACRVDTYVLSMDTGGGFFVIWQR
jgi:hypothetical protein